LYDLTFCVQPAPPFGLDLAAGCLRRRPVKRVYHPPVPADGACFLVERLWPRIAINFSPVLLFGSVFSVLAAMGGAVIGRAIDQITASEPSPECVYTCTERLQRGDTILAVSASRAETKRARAILSSHRAREICLVG
jgi:hypothetical protein